MIWNYRVVKDGNNYFLRVVYYAKDDDYQDVDGEEIDRTYFIKKDIKFSDEDIIGIDLTQEEISVYVDDIDKDDNDKESVRSIVKMLYMMIDDIKDSKVIDMTDNDYNENGLFN